MKRALMNALALLVIGLGAQTLSAGAANAQAEIIDRGEEGGKYCCQMTNCNCCGGSWATCNPEVGCYCK